MGVGWRTIGYDDPRTAELVGGKTTMMDLATVVLVFKWGYNLRQSVHAAACEMAFILTVVALHEWGHALALAAFGCADVVISHRIAWGYTVCVDSAGSGAAAAATTDANDEWWAAAIGVFVGLGYLLLFCGAVRLATRYTSLDLGEAGVAGIYDFGVFWALVWYPCMSLLSQWGDFVTIYHTSSHTCGEVAALGELTEAEGVAATESAGVCFGAVLLFVVVQAAFLCAHSTVRRKTRRVCSGVSAEQEEEEERWASSRRELPLPAGASAATPLPQLLDEPEGVWYVVLLPSAVRTGAELTSEKAGLLATGQQILVTRREQLGERQRLQFVRVAGVPAAVCGWVSESMADGRRIVEPRGLQQVTAQRPSPLLWWWWCCCCCYSCSPD